MTLGHVHLLQESEEFGMCERLCQAIGNHLSSGHIREIDPSSRYFTPDVTVLDVNVLGPGMEDGVLCQCNESLIVAFQRDYLSSVQLWTTKIETLTNVIRLAIRLQTVGLLTTLISPSNVWFNERILHHTGSFHNIQDPLQTPLVNPSVVFT